MSRKLLPLNPRQMVGLADGNSFYCSCEESMQPWLHGKPIIVASNNDGCAIAMNRPAKRYVRMGDALFQIADTIREHGIVTFSSNYELYGDMSNRMHSIWASFVPNLEIYSIDEAFLDFREAGARDHPHHPARNRHPDLSGHRPDQSTGQGRQQARQDGRRPAGALYHRYGGEACGGVEKTPDRRCVGHRSAA